MTSMRFLAFHMVKGSVSSIVSSRALKVTCSAYRTYIAIATTSTAAVLKQSISDVALIRDTKSPYRKQQGQFLFGTRSHQEVGIRWKSSLVTDTERPREKASNYDVQAVLEHGGPLPFSQALFDDYRAAYSTKTLWELIRARAIFALCSRSVLTDNAEKILAMSYRLLGRKASDILIGRTVYDHFVAGDDITSIQKVAQKLREAGLGPLLAVSIEDDVGSLDRSRNQDLLDRNLDKILYCIELTKQLGNTVPMFQLKGTALMTGNLVKSISERCGDTINETVLDATVKAMHGSVVDFSKLPGWESLSPEDNDEFLVALRRFQRVNEAVISGDVIAMMDAEYTYLNPALRLIALAMMMATSQEKSRVFYTYQAYLKKTHGFLESDLALSKSLGFCFGAKLVRGAYLIKERQRAQALGYPDPVQEDFESTSINYHRCLDQLLHRAAQDDASVRFIIATHNEHTVTYALNRMSSLNLKPNGPSVFFGQLYGMADHVSYTLGRLGYSAFKSLPYGSIEETLPYLARRAKENKAVLANARRERALLARAFNERIFKRRPKF